MRKTTSRNDDRDASAKAIPQGYTDKVLMDRFIEIQKDTRQLKQEYNIPTGGVCVMARLAEEAISDTAVRSTFLRLLIDLYEFGREARRRGLLTGAKSKAAVDQNASPALDFPLDLPEQKDKALGGASRAFFGSLDASSNNAR